MSTARGTGRIRDAFVWACTLDVTARKPGNVSLASPGHGMDAAMFLASAAAAADAIAAPGWPVGRRIEQAVRATRAVAGCNTNLGIVLLCAPLAAAAEHLDAGAGAGALRQSVGQVLRSLDVDDARAAYRAIALAQPAGLGRVADQDVACAPSVDLRAVMALAADRDRIARQYVSDFDDVFTLGLAAFDGVCAAQPACEAAQRAMQRTYLRFLAAFPDSHIVRKHGAALAHSVMQQAVEWLRRDEPLADRALVAWDEDLKSQAINPGTAADLCVASAMAAALLANPPLAAPR